MKRQKSPVKVVCKRGAFRDMTICKFVCTVPGATAMFKAKHRKDWYAIMHPSTREPGKTQVTLFDDRGPVGDVARKSCEQALDDMEIRPAWWKLSQVAGAPRAVQARLRRASRRRGRVRPPR